MKILLDTHCWLWWIIEPDKLGDHARRMIQDPENTIFLSAASSMEIAIKYALGKLPLPETPERFVPQRLARDAISSLPIEHMHALRVATLPPHHRDPFDRLIISQSNLEKIPVMTVDPQFEYYEVEIIWGNE
jgi:PIN domain nuclease of toxin-antitoxin system